MIILQRSVQKNRKCEITCSSLHPYIDSAARKTTPLTLRCSGMVVPPRSATTLSTLQSNDRQKFVHKTDFITLTGPANFVNINR